MDHQGSALRFCYLSSQSVMLPYSGPRTRMLLLTRLTHRPSWLVLVSPLKASSQVLFPWICPARPHVWGLGVGGGHPHHLLQGGSFPARPTALSSVRGARASQGSRLPAGPAPAQQGLVSPSAGTWSQVWPPLICTTAGPQPT